MTGWQAKVAQLTTAATEAQAKVAIGRQVSVPGSLETWQDRSAGLAGELAKARGELAAARAVLRALSPDDPVLRPENDHH